MSQKGRVKGRSRAIGKETKSKPKAKRKVLYKNYKEVKKQRNIAILLIPIMIISTITIGIILMNDLEVIIYSDDLNFEDFDSVSFIYKDKGSKHEIQLSEGKNLELKMPKTSEILGFKVLRNQTNTFNNETYSNAIYQNFTWEESQSQSNFECILPNITQSNSSGIYSTNHYLGVDSFFYDTPGGLPKTNWTHRSVEIQQSQGNHDQVAQINLNGYMRRSFSPGFTNATFELWIYNQLYRGLEITFTEQSSGNYFKVGFYSPTLNANNVHLGHDDGTGWVNTSAIFPTKISPNNWYNLRIDFKCNNSENDYMGLENGTMDIYLDDIKIFSQAILNINNAINITDYISYDCKLVGLISIVGDFYIFIDSLSWTSYKEEITKELYQIGDKDITHIERRKEFNYTFSFDKNFKNIKNFSLYFNFETNRTLTGNSIWSNIYDGLFIYDFWNEGFTDLEMPITTNFTIDNTFYFPAIIYLNDSDQESTEIVLDFLISNIHFPFSVNVDFNVSSWFWKEISEFYYISEEMLSFNSEISISSSLEIIENQYIFKTIVNLTEIIGFGSWIFADYYIYNNTIIIEEEIHTFKDIDIANLFWESIFGLKQLEIYVNRIYLDDHYADIDYIFGGIVL